MRSRSFLAVIAVSALVLAAACAGNPTPEPFVLETEVPEQPQPQAAPAAPKPKSELFNKTALLVIDVQNGIFPVWRQEAFLAQLKALIAKAEEAQIPVIYVYHSGSPLLPGGWGWFLHDAIKPPEGHEQVRKELSNAFAQTELEALLDARRVGKVVACGLASQGCVSNTLWGAKGLGYGLILASDAHSTTMSSDEGTIDRVNDSWKGWGAQVLSVAEIVFD
jgi:nicotinamidase-related amidase